MGSSFTGRGCDRYPRVDRTFGRGIDYYPEVFVAPEWFQSLGTASTVTPKDWTWYEIRTCQG